MLVNEALLPNRQPLRASDTVSRALESMTEQRLEKIAIVDFTTQKLLGEVNREDIQAVDAGKNALMAFMKKNPFTIPMNTHIMDATGTLLREKQMMAHITDQENTYFGSLTREDLTESVLKLLNMDSSGSVVMLEVNARDYVLSDIIRIIELESVRIMGVGVEMLDKEEQSYYRISLKLNQADSSKVIHVLNRYGYIITSETATERTDEDLHDRADELMRYLSI
jgi:acetoin utilization protein AcuB